MIAEPIRKKNAARLTNLAFRARRRLTFPTWVSDASGCGCVAPWVAAAVVPSARLQRTAGLLCAMPPVNKQPGLPRYISLPACIHQLYFSLPQLLCSCSRHPASPSGLSARLTVGGVSSWQRVSSPRLRLAATSDSTRSFSTVSCEHVPWAVSTSAVVRAVGCRRCIAREGGGVHVPCSVHVLALPLPCPLYPSVPFAVSPASSRGEII